MGLKSTPLVKPVHISTDVKMCTGVTGVTDWVTQREYLPQQNSVGPNVALRAVNVLEDALWRHPLQRQEALKHSGCTGEHLT